MGEWVNNVRVINFRAPNENNSALLMDKGSRDHLITRDESK